MNAKSVAKHYDFLTPLERFRLILAAGVRQDAAEQRRLENAGQWVTQTAPEHTPFARAFDELAILTFMKLIEEAAWYEDAREAWMEAGEGEDPDDEADEPKEGGAVGPTGRHHRRGGRQRGHGQATAGLVPRSGLLAQDESGPWKLFCERMRVPSFAHWEIFPGFDRLQGSLASTEDIDCRPGVAFFLEGFLAWMNQVRPAGTPELTRVVLTAEGGGRKRAGVPGPCRVVGWLNALRNGRGRMHPRYTRPTGSPRSGGGPRPGSRHRPPGPGWNLRRGCFRGRPAERDQVPARAPGAAALFSPPPGRLEVTKKRSKVSVKGVV